MTRKVRYNKKADAYVNKVQEASADQPAIYEITLSHGDLALPHGFVEKFQHQQLYHTYLFQAGHAASREHAKLVGTSVSLQEAVDDVRRAW